MGSCASGPAWRDSAKAQLRKGPAGPRRPVRRKCTALRARITAPAALSARNQRARHVSMAATRARLRARKRAADVDAARRAGVWGRWDAARVRAGAAAVDDRAADALELVAGFCDVAAQR
eukprot:gene28516-47985_t